MKVNRKRVLLGFYVIGGSFITIFQRYLTFYFDNFTQNFFRFLTGSLSLLLVSIFFFRNDLKKISQDLGQLGKIGLLAILSAFSQFLFGALFWGCLAKVKEVSSFTNTILLVSGAYGLMIGMGLAFMSIKTFGVVIVRLAELSAPVFTGVLGYFLFKETLSLLQIVFGAILISGCFLILPKVKEGKASL